MTSDGVTTWQPGPAARIGLPLLVGVVGVALWQLVVGVLGVFERLVPTPTAIVAELRANVGAIADSTVVTGGNAVIGLAVGGLLGVLLAAAAARARWVDGMVAPLVAALAVIPVVALAPVLNAMFGADMQTGRRTIAAIAAFVPVFVNTLRGLRQTTPLQRDLLRSHAAGGGQVFRVLTLPTAAPYVVTGLRVASSLAVISALVAEYFGGPRGGLGSFISTSAATGAYARAWAYVGASILLGLALYLLTVALERLVQSRLGPRG
jgi:NitT/TauT family transport system permease protein